MKGQWFGDISGTNTGHVILDLDQRPGGFSGSGALFDLDSELPGSTYDVVLVPADGKGAVEGHADFRICFNKASGAFLTPDLVREHFPNAVHPKRVTFTGTWNEGLATLQYQSDIGTKGTIGLRLQSVGKESLASLTDISWADFKVTMAERAGVHIFRGQNGPRPLRTSFHRSGRFDMYRFALEDTRRISNAVSSTIGRQLSTTGGEEMIALLGIAQHHGFPTPLLDWTRSPYIAAYFACKGVLDGKKGPPVVFTFDQQAWFQSNLRSLDISAPIPAFALFEPVPMLNPRVLQQQSVLMMSNVDNIESFIQNREKANGETYLTAWKITDEPRRVLRDLRIMGVYAGSMFPGLEGMCRGAFEDSIEPT